MEYTIKRLADLAGISARTLRWYDQKGLLKPSRINDAGYRLYDQQAVIRLQQILFYKELDFPLSEIQKILDSPDFSYQKALKGHLAELLQRRERLDALILTVNNTLDNLQGGMDMSDQERFTAFREAVVKENEEKYGEEIRKKYGDQTMDSTNAAMMKLSEKEYQEWTQTGDTILELLEQAIQTGAAPESPEGQKIAELHRAWCFRTLGTYDPQKHAGIAGMYTMDPRFLEYYDQRQKGCAKFLQDAVAHYTRT